MPDFLEPSFSWPTWPATVLVIVCCAYWLLVIVGAMTFDALDFDLPDIDIDADVDGSLLDLGFIPLRFLNIGRVPLMLWLSIFALCAWLTSRLIAVYGGISQPHPDFNYLEDSLAIVRDFAIAAVATKVLTQPLRGRFDAVEPIKAADLIGKMCVITTGEATARGGEAQFATGGAPLVLNVRATDGNLEKGELAEIFNYSPDENVYFVKRAKQEV